MLARCWPWGTRSCPHRTHGRGAEGGGDHAECRGAASWRAAVACPGRAGDSADRRWAHGLSRPPRTFNPHVTLRPAPSTCSVRKKLLGNAICPSGCPQVCRRRPESGRAWGGLARPAEGAHRALAGLPVPSPAVQLPAPLPSGEPGSRLGPARTTGTTAHAEGAHGSPGCTSAALPRSGPCPPAGVSTAAPQRPGREHAAPRRYADRRTHAGGPRLDEIRRAPARSGAGPDPLRGQGCSRTRATDA